MLGKRNVLRELVPREQRQRRAAGVKKRAHLAGGAEFSRKAQRFIKCNTRAHVADAERNHGKSRNRRRRFLIHPGCSPQQLEQAKLLPAAFWPGEMFGGQFRTALVEPEFFARHLEPPSHHPSPPSRPPPPRSPLPLP